MEAFRGPVSLLNYRSLEIVEQFPLTPYSQHHVRNLGPLEALGIRQVFRRRADSASDALGKL